MGRLFRNGLKTVAVVMGNIRGGFVERCWESLTACARAKNCNLLALPGEVDLQAGMTAARCDEAHAFARAGNVDGVVVLGSNIRLVGFDDSCARRWKNSCRIWVFRGISFPCLPPRKS